MNEQNVTLQDGLDLEQRFNRAFGCGYPSDPLSRKWLQDCFDPIFGFPSIVRFSWSTARKKLQTGNGKDAAYWFDLIDEEKKNAQAKKGTQSKSQQKLQVQVRPALATRKIKPFFSRKLQLKRDVYASL